MPNVTTLISLPSRVSQHTYYRYFCRFYPRNLIATVTTHHKTWMARSTIQKLRLGIYWTVVQQIELPIQDFWSNNMPRFSICLLYSNKSFNVLTCQPKNKIDLSLNTEKEQQMTTSFSFPQRKQVNDAVTVINFFVNFSCECTGLTGDLAFMRHLPFHAKTLVLCLFGSRIES